MSDTPHRHHTFGNYTSVGNIVPNVPSFAVTTNGTTAMVIPEGIPESFARGMAELELDTIEQLRAELAATEHLLHDSLSREDKFYRELSEMRTQRDAANSLINETNTTKTNL